MATNGKNSLSELRKEEKLTLVLDLDQTLIDFADTQDLTPDERYLLNLVDSEKDEGSLHIVQASFPFDKMKVKLRPFVREFLKEASQIFDLYICTLGSREHASQMLPLFDPDNEYFPSSKVITQSDFKEKLTKDLDLVRESDSTTIILDDIPRFWTRHKENVINIKPYHYFTFTCKNFKRKYKSLAERKEDEDASVGGLAYILSDLKQAHHMYFSGSKDDQDEIKDKDVRQILKKIRYSHALNLSLESQSVNSSVTFKDHSSPIPIRQQFCYFQRSLFSRQTSS